MNKWFLDFFQSTCQFGNNLSESQQTMINRYLARGILFRLVKTLLWVWKMQFPAAEWGIEKRRE